MSADRLVDAVAEHCAAVVMSGGVEPLTSVHIVGGRGAFLACVIVNDATVARVEAPTRQQAIDDARAQFVEWSERELDDEAEATAGIARLAQAAKVIPFPSGARR